MGKRLNNIFNSNILLKKSDFAESNISDQKRLSFSINSLEKKGYRIGIPVRYHDVINLNKVFNLKMLEFHMSDRDLILTLKNT